MASPQSSEWRDNTHLLASSVSAATQPSPSHSEAIATDRNALKSFDIVRNPRERRAKELAQWLEAKCSEYPELSRHLERAIKAIIKESKRNKKQDSDRVLSALERGPGTIEEITRRVGLPQPTVYAILTRLPMAAFIEVRDEYMIREPGRGGYRRPRKIYSLK